MRAVISASYARGKGDAQRLARADAQAGPPCPPSPRGVGHRLVPAEVDAAELAAGTEIEMEHVIYTPRLSAEEKRTRAETIALDHLEESADYYSRYVPFRASQGEVFDPATMPASAALLAKSLRG